MLEGVGSVRGVVVGVNVTSAWVMRDGGLLRVKGGTEPVFLLCTRYWRYQVGEVYLK